MSNAKKCDRCGAFHETPSDGWRGRVTLEEVRNNDDMARSRNKHDLCPNCHKLFGEWMNTSQNTSEQSV